MAAASSGVRSTGASDAGERGTDRVMPGMLTAPTDNSGSGSIFRRPSARSFRTYAVLVSVDPRRDVPRTDTLLADPRLSAVEGVLGRGLLKEAVHRVQQRIRAGEVRPEHAVDAVLADLPASTTTLRPVLNATGVLVHTNLGRAPLSRAAAEAMNTVSAN